MNPGAYSADPFINNNNSFNSQNNNKNNNINTNTNNSNNNHNNNNMYINASNTNIQQQQQNIQSTSSSYTSTTSPSNFTTFSYNSPSVHPPAHLNIFPGNNNSLSSRTGSIDNLSSSINSNNNINSNSNSNLLSTSNNSFSKGSSFLRQYQNQQSNLSSSLTPAGRRSLLTSKIQAHIQQQNLTHNYPTANTNNNSNFQPSDFFIRKNSSNFSNNNCINSAHVSNSYSNNSNDNISIPNFQASNNSFQSQKSFTPFPTPATATTDISKDIAFSTNSSSSTLYQDAQSQIDCNSNNSKFYYPNQIVSASAPTISNINSSSLTQSKNFQFGQNDHIISESQIPTDPSYAANDTQANDSKSDHLDIANYPVHDLLLMLSALLQKILEANDLLHTDDEKQHQLQYDNNNNSNNSKNNFESPSTGLLNSKYSANVLAFHGRNIPAISLHAYLTRILKYCPVTNDVFLCLLVYFDRIAKRVNNNEGKTKEDEIMMDKDEDIEDINMTKNNNNDINKPQVFVMDSYNIHRLIISGITVASKFFSDVFYKNSRYAKVGGLPLDELNHLELQFLLLLDFKLMIQREELERYGDLLLRFWKREQSKKINEDQSDDIMTDK